MVLRLRLLEVEFNVRLGIHLGSFSAWNEYSGTMDHSDPYFEELFNALEDLIEAQIVRQKPVRPYGEFDDPAASLAFSKLPTLDEPLSPRTQG